MAPTLTNLLPRFDPGATSSNFRDEWSNPSNYAFTILLLIGGDLVNRALAQLVGGWIAPVAFSFGWVSYATSAVCTALGSYRLMPDADTGVSLINGKNGYVRGNNSWVLGRMMRDYEKWMDPLIRTKKDELIEARWKFDQSREKEKYGSEARDVPRPAQAGLVVGVYEASKSKPAGIPGRDMLFYSGLLVTTLQLGIASIPAGLDGEWGVLMITGAATTLCYFTGGLHQWRVEKWACRRLDSRDQKKNFILTRGNGAQHAIAILSDGHGLDLEDLASGFSMIDYPVITIWAQLATIVLGVLWVALLITASGVDGSWYLIGVGGVGMLQNIFVAGWKRTPEAYGVPLVFREVVGEAKVMGTLLELERRYEKLGKSMLGTFFPGDLRGDEVRQWEEVAEGWRERKEREGGREDRKGK